MLKLQSLRGTHDLFGTNVDKFNFIEDTFKHIALLYGFEEIRTPIIESTDVFTKHVGTSSDIITKEMYTFTTKGGEEIALRPEGTAPVVRALISNGLTNNLPAKLFYLGAMFRYERPQKGRQRQFHHLGVETLGTNSYISDIEGIALACNILTRLGIKNYKVLINTLGSTETLNNYKKILLQYLYTVKTKLSSDSLIRLEKNPLRILDSKDENDKEIIKQAPKITTYLNAEDNAFYQKVLKGLNNLNINFTVDNTLVRGLDYYTHTVFEIITNEIGSQGTLIAGGRYNHLIKQMGGIDTGAFGFAGGIERISLMLQDIPKPQKSIALITAKDDYNDYALTLAKDLRKASFPINFILGKDISTKIKKTSSQKHFLMLIIGEQEFNNKTLKIKEITTEMQQEISLKDITKHLNIKYNSYKIQSKHFDQSL